MVGKVSPQCKASKASTKTRLEAVLMYSGVFTLIVQGLRHPRVGGFGRVWNIAVESGRTSELFRFDPRIDQYNSVWINLISGTITWLASFGVNQLAIQRYASLPTLHQAQGEEDEIIALGLYSAFWQKGLQVELAITATHTTYCISLHTERKKPKGW
ncbi:hypothetical protein ANCDUO_02081 [Ancylostoma duodenale]|uniref:Uncharacterized protein n=1 Tax=Ancylostoma duodenale TaxID=51022 RepID=A0A0C2H1F4_9BILA|nr:hypothetical protein ANCDUO_02081 [Ancylostoma duodenale]